MTEKMRRTLAWRPDLRAFRPPALGGTPTGSRDGWRGKDGQTLTGGSRLAAWVNFVKLPHTAFALPFAIIGTVYASFRYPVGWIQVAWIFLAFSAARFAAMAFNRIVDARLDAANARTSGRELPTGRLRSTEA
ncbi:MAG: UbiA family prenyltransferase, partial [Gemmatimonadales bacterium]